MNASIVDTFVEVTLPESRNFLKVRETLTRMGVGSHKTKTLYQSCHILHKKGRYYIVHFKEMFLLDGKETNFVDEDRTRRNRIAHLLHEWNLVKLVDPDKTASDQADMSAVLVIPYSQKNEWTLESKYTIGK